MGKIYEHAVCTIAANVHKTDQGLFSLIPGDWEPFRRKNIPVFPEPLEWLWRHLTGGGPLNGRAWCLQERYLSRRILSIHDSNIWT
jgi:hypothetical protein